MNIQATQTTDNDHLCVDILNYKFQFFEFLIAKLKDLGPLVNIS